MILSRQALRKSYDIYIVFVMTVSTGAFVTNFIGKEEANPEGSPVLKIVWGLIYIVTLLRLIPRRREALQIIKANKPLLCLVLLALASTVWSIDPLRSFATASTLAFTSLVALEISLSYGIQRQLRAICLVLFVVIALSVIVEVFLPGFVPGGSDQGDAWHGVFVAKNNLGRTTCLCVTAFITRFESAWVRCLMVAGGIGIALMSQSVSAVVYIGAMVLLVASWSIVKWKRTPRAIAIAFIVVMASAAIAFTSQNLKIITPMVGKDPHLSKRTDLWKLSLAAVREKPALGYGFVAFWNADSQPAARIREELSWDVPHAHNGYIEISLGLGMVGLGLCALVYVGLLKRAYFCFMDGTESYRRWPLSFLATTILYQFTESTILNGNNVNFLLFCCVAFSLSEKDQRRYTPAERLSSVVAA